MSEGQLDVVAPTKVVDKIVVTNAVFGRPAMAQAMAQLRNVRFNDGRTAYWVMRVCKKYDSEFKKASAFYKELMAKFSVTEEQLQKDETPADFKQADEAFQETQVEFGFHKLTLSSLIEARLSASFMEALEPLLIFDLEDPEPEPSNVLPLHPEQGAKK